MKDEPDLGVKIIPVEQAPLAKPAEKPVPSPKTIEPDWVIHYRVRPKGYWWRWVAAFIQMATGCFVAWIFLMIPVDVSFSPFLSWKNPVVVFILICYLGKTLYDTLFYDHYQP
jgi:hypothetical protein